MVHAPKRYVIDAALIAAALRLNTQAVLGDGNMLGRILDTFVVAQLRPETIVAESEPRMHHLRTEAGRHEVDVLAELGGERVIAIEIKAAAAPPRTPSISAGSGQNSAIGSPAASFCTGPRLYELAEGTVAAPISTLWG